MAIIDDEARVEAHYKNVLRYRRSLAAPLTASEKDDIVRRILEERASIERLTTSLRFH
jgi:hypothetical protein